MADAPVTDTLPDTLLAASAHTTVHRLRFNDTDRLGHVNNAVFAVMLEQGRTELATVCRLPVGTQGQALVIVRLELDFVRELNWPGDVRIETEVSRIGTRSFTLRQRLFQDDVLCGRAQTVLVVMDRSAARAVPLTEEQRASLAPWVRPD